MKPAWFPDWTAATAVVLASGPSAAALDLSPLAAARVIAVNDAWRLWPAADALYACDRAWWGLHKDARAFAGLKITEDARAARAYALQRIEVRNSAVGLVTDPGVVGNGRNGGFHALNLAVQFGARKIVLVGFDMHRPKGQPLHFFGDHPSPLNNPRVESLASWRKRLDAVAPQLTGLGVEVVNATPGSALTAYPFVDLTQRLLEAA